MLRIILDLGRLDFTVEKHLIFGNNTMYDPGMLCMLGNRGISQPKIIYESMYHLNFSKYR